MALAGCDLAQPGLSSSLRPEARPTRAVEPTAPAPTYQPSAESQRLRAFYTRLEQDLMVRGLMRTDSGLVDAPYTERQLAENFIKIALFTEGTTDVNSLASDATEADLRRWETPVRIALRQGPSVTGAARAQQQMQLRNYARRLGQVTGHPVTAVEPGRDNFAVFVVDEDERKALGPELAAFVPNIDPAAIRTIADLPPTISCIVFVFSLGRAEAYNRALAVIRSEHPPASWRSCLHEEVAQGLGLTNDSPGARPSIFNDDEEFALLTQHDEQLLEMLYDERLKVGMTIPEARPIVRAIAEEILAAGPV